MKKVYVRRVIINRISRRAGGPVILGTTIWDWHVYRVSLALWEAKVPIASSDRSSLAFYGSDMDGPCDNTTGLNIHK